MYKRYINLFSTEEEDCELIENFFADITNQIDIRTQEKIFEKAETMHRILKNNEKCDASIMLFEILILCLKEKGLTGNFNRLLDVGENLDIANKIGAVFYKKIKEYLDYYVQKGSAILGVDEKYLKINDSIIGKCFVLLESLYTRYSKGYCGRFFISSNIETEVNFAREINTLLMV